MLTAFFAVANTSYFLFSKSLCERKILNPGQQVIKPPEKSPEKSAPETPKGGRHLVFGDGTSDAAWAVCHVCRSLDSLTFATFNHVKRFPPVLFAIYVLTCIDHIP